MSENSGRVEIYHDGQWGTVCGEDFDKEDADVVCKMMGYGEGLVVRDERYGPGSDPIWLDDVNCQAHETDLDDCEHRPWGEHNCDHDNDIGVECY